MADPRRNQGHLGIDTNVLVAYLDVAHPFHKETKWLADESIVLNPTIAHEAYHTLVFWAKWEPEEARRAVLDACMDEKNLFVNQTMRTTKTGMELAVKYRLGGRDALIIASLLVSRVREFRSLDKDLLALRQIRFGRSSLAIKPVRRAS